MKFFLSTILFLTSFFLFSQETNIKKSIGDEPYPAPVMYNNVSVSEAAFIGLFENINVTNLHVYPDLKGNEDYHYKGKIINATFSNFLPADISAKTFVKGSEPRAVYSIRGDGEEIYMIRLPNKKSNYELALYGMENGKLAKLHSLASYTCKNNRCIQIDSWLTDINGDTRIDIVQKRKVIKKNGNQKIKGSVYLMDGQGQFKRSKKVNIDLNEYQMNWLW